ncbi:transcriptional regulator [Pseudomonas sp. C27(2019)]|uniref:Rho-binding antiterminator n=1 Tax=Pseudomonas sp. C27(2019) TaxID=2604941 RepID=UPI0012462A28|nr:Rho-binding antiterminator [Pseudomonas sp. C27(2019)]QEY58046.1 transcriptional regulator [Pseudomonas sp. C27(2019)]
MLTCDQHDYIEIVCTFRYPIKLTMKSGMVMDCVALDTARNENSDECIKVAVNSIEHWVVLADISMLEVCVDNPHFHRLSFG